MRMLVLSATEMELESCRNYFQKADSSKIIKFQIIGIGAIAAAFNTYKYITRFRPDWVILGGIAGSFDKKITLGSTFLVHSELQVTVGVEENGQWKDVFDMGFVQKNQAPYCDGLLVNPFLEKYNSLRLPIVKGISVDEITTNREREKVYIEKYNPILESMEGAAFHYVCLQLGIPFLQVRSISNYVGEREKPKWDFKNALTNLNNQLISLIEQL